VPADFDEWHELGARGWNWEGVLPYFRRLENDADFDGPLHGNSGPVHIGRQPRSEWAPFDRALTDVMAGMRWSEINDMNARFDDGVGILPVSAAAGRRSSAGIAYLSEAVRRRPNLMIRTNTRASHLSFGEQGVDGVHVIRDDNTTETVHGREVIVSAGALQTPLLLKRSGIGPSDELRAIGIAPRIDLPGVGAHLQNHPMVAMMAFVRRGAHQSKRFRSAGATYLRWSSEMEGCQPADLSMWVRPEVSWHALGRRLAGLYPVLARPASFGSVRLGATSADDAARIEFNFLSDERDFLRMKQAFKLAARILLTERMGEVIRAPFVLSAPMGLLRYNVPNHANRVRTALASILVDMAPALGEALVGHLGKSSSIAQLIDDDAAVDHFIRTYTIGTGHVTGTCRMGAASDPWAVVDTEGRVLGIGGLRVADASVMPRVPSGNTQIPTIMVAEKIADAIKGKLSAGG